MEVAMSSLSSMSRLLLAFTLLTSACAGSMPGPGGSSSSSPALVDPPRRQGKPLILIAMPDSASFRSVRRALVEEIKKDLDVVTQIVEAGTTLAAFTAEVEKVHPACLVLMDNPTVRLYRAYQKAAQGAPVPALVVMASFLEELRGELQNASGVAYEVPGVTAFVNLRSVIERQVTRVGVVHRPPFRRFVERQKVLAAKEQVQVVAEEVPTDPSAADVRRALRSLRMSGVDALWVLNDNALLKDAQFLESAWRPEIAALAVPVVVGVPTLVSAEARFGTFAVLPDLDALGVQAANVLFEISESDWHAGEHPVELPVSTLTVVNMKQVRQQFGLRDGGIRRIDRAIE
jgi:hypothetical protein